MLVATGKRVPLTNNVVVDQGAVLELVDQIRVAMPEEVRQAQRITEEAGRIVEHAREESDAIARAQEQAAHMLEGGSSFGWRSSAPVRSSSRRPVTRATSATVPTSTRPASSFDSRARSRRP